MFQHPCAVRPDAERGVAKLGRCSSVIVRLVNAATELSLKPGDCNRTWVLVERHMKHSCTTHVLQSIIIITVIISILVLVLILPTEAIATMPKHSAADAALACYNNRLLAYPVYMPACG